MGATKSDTRALNDIDASLDVIRGILRDTWEARIASRVGLSTATKPTAGVVVGSTFFETDTGVMYIYDGSAWQPYQTTGGLATTKILARDVAANDSDKTFTVPAATQWDVYSVYVKCVSTATAGNRQIAIEIDDGTNVFAVSFIGTVQAASLTRFYMFARGLGRLTATDGPTAYTMLWCALPQLPWLPAGYRIRVYDVAAIDAAADDMDVTIFGQELTF